ncbi:unnamed protein product [Chrysoparadoxa australica]
MLAVSPSTSIVSARFAGRLDGLFEVPRRPPQTSLPCVGDRQMDSKRPDKVLPYLYIGSKAHAKQKGTLKDLGIKRILNVTPDRTTDPVAGCPNFFEKDSSFTYMRVPIFDHRGENIIVHLEKCIAFIDRGKHHGSVLVHCNKGVSRSSSMVLSYLMKKRGLGLEEALSYLKSRRSVVMPQEAFMEQLRRYEQELSKERAEAEGADADAEEWPDDLIGHRRGQGVGVRMPMGPAKRAIGPAMPPSKGAEEAIGPARGPGKPVEEVTGPVIGPSKAAEGAIGPAIGPAMPPSKDAEDAIGPAMPPSNSDGDSEGHQKRPGSAAALPERDAKRSKE